MFLYIKRGNKRSAKTLVSSSLFFCSFVNISLIIQSFTWVFIDAGFSESYIGHGVGNQAAKGTVISKANAKPGDFAVYSDNSHIGIIAGSKDDGSLLVIHCAAGANNVSITSEEGFGYCVRVVGKVLYQKCTNFII